MKKLISFIISLSIMIYSFSMTICAAKDYITTNDMIDISLDDNFADNRVIVVLDNDTSLKFNEYVASDFSFIGCKQVYDLSSYTSSVIKTAMENIAQHIMYGEELIEYDVNNFSKYNQILCLDLDTSSKSDVISAIKTLLKIDGIAYACPDYVVKATKSSNDIYINNSNYDLSYLNKIQLFNAWDITTGSNTVRVGVLDTGINESHPDLIDNINSTLCRDFTNGVMTACTHEDEYADTHGTHVAGIIGAKGNNRKGISGVCWDVELVSLRVLNSEGWGLSSYVYSAINYANENNFDIINMSLGWESSSWAQMNNYNQVLNEVIENFNGLAVCAAGNKAKDIGLSPVYPASYNIPNMITVGATGNADEVDGDDIWCDVEHSEGSNFGDDEVDLFAPGYAIWSTCGDEYIRMKGTSQAAPMVAGVAALMLSVNQNLSPEEIKYIIMEKVDSIQDLANLCVSGGRLNAYNAVNHAQDHSLSVTHNSSIHTFSCSSCDYTKNSPHDLYIHSESSNSYLIKCATIGCEYNAVCGHTPIYEYSNTTEHKVSCPNGCFTDFYESHGTCVYEYTITSTYTHNATCQDCGYTFSQPHSWKYNGSIYQCLLCGKTSTQAPSIMQTLPPSGDVEDQTE